MGIVNRLRGKGKLQGKDKKCPKCGKIFSDYKLERENGGKIVKCCPFCGCMIANKQESV